MTAKEYLLQIRKCERKIFDLTDDYNRVQELATRVTPILHPDVVSGGGVHDNIGLAGAELADIAKELQEKIAFYKAIKADVVETISKVEKEPLHHVLYKRYVDMKTWEQIAIEMNYSYQWVCGRPNGRLGLHDQALQAVEKLLEEKRKGD